MYCEIIKVCLPKVCLPNIWANPDLIYSDRKANFNARFMRRDKVKAMQTESQSTDFALQNQSKKAN